MSEVKSLNFENIHFRNYKGKITVEEHGVKWEVEDETSTNDAFSTKDITKIDCLNSGKRFMVRFFISSPGLSLVKRFTGFRDHHIADLKTFISRNWGMVLDVQETYIGGQNGGELELEDHSLNFKVKGKSAARLYFDQMDQCCALKNDFLIEFENEEGAFDQESLSEIRFHVQAENKESSGELVRRISERADLTFSPKNTIAQFKDVLLLTPRGRFDAGLSRTDLYLRGKTFSFKIPLQGFANMFLLPNLNEANFLVIRLKKPLVQGKTLYPFVILSFPQKPSIKVPVDLRPEEFEKYKSKLKPEMEGPPFKVITRVLKTLSSTKVFMPGSFSSTSKNKFLRCALRASSGLLYPLEASFIFCHKPCVYIQHADIAKIEFSRLLDNLTSTRLFDLKIVTRRAKRDLSSKGKESVLMFTGIDKKEFPPLFSFLRNKALEIVDKEILEKSVKKMNESGERSRRNANQVNLILPGSEESSSGGSDFEGVESSDTEGMESEEAGKSEDTQSEPMEDDVEQIDDI